MAFGLPGIGNNTDEATKKNARDLDTANIRIDQLERQFREMMLTNQALWELLQQHGGFSPEALEEKVESIKNSLLARANETLICNACERTVPADKASCYYCGAKLNPPD